MLPASAIVSVMLPPCPPMLLIVATVARLKLMCTGVVMLSPLVLIATAMLNVMSTALLMVMTTAMLLIGWWSVDGIVVSDDVGTQDTIKNIT